MQLLFHNTSLHISYGKSHHIYMDNYFLSPELFIELEQNNTRACGTLRVNRRGVHAQIKSAKPAIGEMITVRQENQLFISWTDKRQVNLVSNVHNASTFQRKTRCKRGQGANPDDLFRLVDKPKATELYTRFMGGVDRADQLVALHMNIHKSTKWWKKVFFHLLETSMSNASVLFKKFYDAKRFRPE